MHPSTSTSNSFVSVIRPYLTYLLIFAFFWLIFFTQIPLSSQSSPSPSRHHNPKIYDLLDSSQFCFRRLNQTHQIGCGSSSFTRPNYGIAKMVRSGSFEDQQEDLEFLVRGGRDPPYVAVLTLRQFSNLSLVLVLKEASHDRIAGIVVLDEEDLEPLPDGFSPDRSCPNEYSSLYVNSSKYGHCRTQAWNHPKSPYLHEGLMFQNLPFPVFLLRNQSQIDLLRKKIVDYCTQDRWPKLAIELTASMHAARDSVTCMRRSVLSARYHIFPDIQCDPLEGYNIFYHTLDLSQTRQIEPNSVVVLAARQDSFSMFEGMAPGADSAISSLVTILAISEMLNQPSIKRKMDPARTKKALLLALFDGEAFDYIGSSDSAYQMERNLFNLMDPKAQMEYPSLNLSHLSHFIELNQLAQYRGEGIPQKIFLHKNLNSTEKMEDLVNMIHHETYGLVNLTVKDVDEGRPLPPASAQSFLKKRSDPDFTVLVATNHEKEYTNKYYNSYREDESHLSLPDLALRLTDLSTLFGRVAYRLVTGEQMDHAVRANLTTVQGLLTCFLQNSNCDLFLTVEIPNTRKQPETVKAPYSTYVSVHGASKPLREYTRFLMFRFTGQTVEGVNSSEECHELNANRKSAQFQYIWMNGASMAGECILSSSYMVPSHSPAVQQVSIYPSTWELIPENLPHYSLWTESKWQETQLRIFVLPSPTDQVLIVSLGVAILVLSFLIGIFMDRHAHQLFGNGSINAINIVSISKENGSVTVATTCTLDDHNAKWITGPNGITNEGVMNIEMNHH